MNIADILAERARSHADIGAWIGRYARAQGWNPADRCLSLTAMSFNFLEQLLIKGNIPFYEP